MKLTKKGMLLAIEGVDGAGKNTQVSALKLAYEKQGRIVSTYSFPDYSSSFLGSTLSEFLSGRFGNAAEIHPKLSAPIFALERSEKRTSIEADLAAGNVVFCDRYVYSNVAHQACRLPQSERSDFQAWIERLEFKILSMPQPTHTILLDVDDDQAEVRRVERMRKAAGSRPLDDYERDIEGLSNARQIYLGLATQYKWIKIPTKIDGVVLSKEKITSQIIFELENSLNDTRTTF